MPPNANAADQATRLPLPPDRVVAEAEAQWIFSEAELANSPSIQDGMTVEEEQGIRAKGVNFIVQVGILLKLPQLTLSTAVVFFHRFLMRASLKKAKNGIPKLHHFEAAATALFLATKVEESCRKITELVQAFCRVAQKNPNLIVDPQTKDYWTWRDKILFNEDLLLEVLCFDLTIESPHRQLFDMLRHHKLEHNKQLRNAAWAFVTDSNNTQLCLLASSRSIAAAALYAASNFCEVDLPNDSRDRPWWEAQHVKYSELRHAIEYMVASLKGKEASQGAANGGTETNIYTNLEPPSSMGRFDGASSERRSSADSAAGVKRVRDDLDSNGDSQDGKRTKINGSSRHPAALVPDIADRSASHDIKHDEEAERVRNGNAQSKKAVEAMEEGELAE